MSDFVKKIDGLARDTRKRREAAKKSAADSLIEQISDQLEEIARRIPADIELDARGGESGSEEINGFVRYDLEREPTYQDLDFSTDLEIKKGELAKTRQQIEATDGYRKVHKLCGELGLRLEMREVNNGYDEFSLSFYVSGWGRMA